MGLTPAEHVTVLADVDELRLELGMTSRRCARLLDDTPLFTALFRLCAPDASAVEVAIVLRMILRLRVALCVIEHALLDRSLKYRGLQRHVAAALGIKVPALTNRRTRLPQLIEQGKAANPNPRRPKQDEAAVRPNASAIVSRYEHELEHGLSRSHAAVPDDEDYWQVLVHVWLTGPALPHQTAAADIIDGLHVLAHLGHQLNRLEANWLDRGRELGMPNGILGAPTGRRSPAAVWKARRRLHNGTSATGTFSTARQSPTSNSTSAPLAAPAGLDNDVRAAVAELLAQRTPLGVDPDADSWLDNLATAFPKGETGPLPETSTALALFVIWDLWNSPWQKDATLGPVLHRGMDVRRRAHAWRRERDETTGKR